MNEQFEKRMNEACKKAMNKFERNIQYIIAMEEASEFIQELSKNIRYNDLKHRINLISEIIDLEIMIKQVKIQLFQKEHVGTLYYSEIYQEKLKRMEQLVK